MKELRGCRCRLGPVITITTLSVNDNELLLCLPTSLSWYHRLRLHSIAGEDVPETVPCPIQVFMFHSNHPACIPPTNFFRSSIRQASSLDTTTPHKIPGITAPRFPTLSLPNFSMYHFFPPSARGNIVAISLITNVLAGTHAKPPTIQYPHHSIHSHT